MLDASRPSNRAGRGAWCCTVAREAARCMFTSMGPTRWEHERSVRPSAISKSTTNSKSQHRVLQALVHPLTHYLKFHVLRYNARGVGRSSGWKSFTGLQEGEDLRELVQYALKRLGDVRQVTFIVRVVCLFRPSNNSHIHTGILKWRTDCIAASRITSAHTHRSRLDIVPTWPAWAPHSISHRDVPTCA